MPKFQSCVVITPLSQTLSLKRRTHRSFNFQHSQESSYTIPSKPIRTKYSNNIACIDNNFSNKAYINKLYSTLVRGRVYMYNVFKVNKQYNFGHQYHAQLPLGPH